MRRIALTAALALLLLPAPALAWTNEGHQIVARLAYEQLTPKAKAAYDALMKAAPGQATPSCPAATPEDVGVWADCVRPLKERFDYLAPFHYEHRALCEKPDPKLTCADGKCVTAEVPRAETVLKDKARPATERLLALEELVHFIADLHQPLHTADHVDDGGWFVAVEGKVEGQALSKNLHLVWDDDVVRSALGADPAKADDQLRPLMRAKAKAWSGGEVEDWVSESFDLARTYAYGQLPAPPACGKVAGKQALPESYLKGAAPIVRERLVKASLRLAKVLNRDLG
ncbi:S1/P1 nuclease [Phenylobacterium soli]|uniref:Endonuclease n=1 Tax=Phenylobacterium soli TaxID=2170551 RepID=A0A328AMB2_9CAUL|nr:S1/P1 nuclease [Phenylobacterium soli]RAK54564.1 hypothetical protein DJ017_08525 [Phenylobacterium soli]